MAYECLGEGALDYYPCRYGNSKLVFRGPQKKLDEPYVAVIGGSETYGKFVERPFTEVLEDALPLPVVNLGCVNAGLDAFNNDDAVIDVCRHAAVTVVQLTGAQNISNKYYTVHPRRNDRFLKASKFLVKEYPDVDFTEFNFTRHLLQKLCERSPESFQSVQQELEKAWVSRMRILLNEIGGKILFLWLADHAPGDQIGDEPLGHDPMFVQQWMLDALAEKVVKTVEVSTSSEIKSAGFDRMVFTALEEPAAHEMLGPVAHEAAARALQEAVRPLI